MPTIAIICGVLLILIGVVGYFGTGASHPTALIPAAIGILLGLLGLLAGFKEDLRRHLMHAAVVVALLAFIAVTARLAMGMGKFSGSPAEIASISTALVCLAFTVLAIRSFAAARRSAAE